MPTKETPPDVMKTFTALIRQAVRAAGRAADEAEQAATTRVIACKGIPIQLMPSLSWPQPQACARLLLSTPLSGLPDATAAMLGRVNAALLLTLGCCIAHDDEGRPHVMATVERAALAAGELAAAAERLAAAGSIALETLANLDVAPAQAREEHTC